MSCYVLISQDLESVRLLVNYEIALIFFFFFFFGGGGLAWLGLAVDRTPIQYKDAVLPI